MRATGPPRIELRLATRERPPGHSVLRMRWENLCFLHWAWDPGEIQRALPPGLFVDTFDRQAWLGVVPFAMRRVHPRGLPCVPWLSDFLELNVRTYVYDGQGLPGVWFFSLSCNQPLAVWMARRFFHLNYVHAEMAAEPAGRSLRYSARRRGGDQSLFVHGAAGPLEPASPESIEFFLVERYVLFSAAPGALFSGRVHHSPYQVGTAEVERWDFGPARADGFAEPGRSPDHAMIAATLEVEAWPIGQLQGR